MWGCLVKVQVPIPKRVKIGPKTVDCIFIGYATNSKACWFLIHISEHSDIHDNRLIESDIAEFFEQIYLYKTRLELPSEGSKRPLEEPKENELNKEIQRRSKCQRTSTSFRSDFLIFLLENESHTFKETHYWQPLTMRTHSFEKRLSIVRLIQPWATILGVGWSSSRK